MEGGRSQNFYDGLKGWSLTDPLAFYLNIETSLTFKVIVYKSRSELSLLVQYITCTFGRARVAIQSFLKFMKTNLCNIFFKLHIINFYAYFILVVFL
jgi:hypothetical protein